MWIPELSCVHRLHSYSEGCLEDHQSAVCLQWLTNQSIAYGTSSITQSGVIAAPGSVYPPSGETASFVINGSTVQAPTDRKVLDPWGMGGDRRHQVPRRVQHRQCEGAAGTGEVSGAHGEGR